jgi:hypothetical protein
LNDERVEPRRDARDTNLIDMHGKAAGGEGLFAQRFQNIDLRRSRNGVRVDLHREI